MTNKIELQRTELLDKWQKHRPNTNILSDNGLGEILDTYDQDGNLLKTISKKEILAEQKRVAFETGDSSFAVPVVYLLLSHPENGVYVVQRANKSENPYLWCKPVGGHIGSGDDPDSTLLREGKEEIKTDIVLAKSIGEYFDLISQDSLIEHAIVRKIDFQPWFGTYRVDRDTRKNWMKRTRAHIYAGVYRGSIGFTNATNTKDFVDGLGEAVGVKIYDKNDLQRILSSGDPNFTHDLGILVRDYHAFL